MKTDKKTWDIFTNRQNWLQSWLRHRNYDIGAKRKDFIFVYYSTLCVIYSPTQAQKIVLKANSRFLQPLGEDTLKSIIRTVNAAGGYKLTNQCIIDKLGITPTEVEALCIGHNLKEKAARSQRKDDRKANAEQLVAQYLDGTPIHELAAMFPCFSKSTIERILQPYAATKKQGRDRTIWNMAATGHTVSVIAAAVGCSQPTVRRVLNGTKPSNLTITETLRSESEASSFADPAGMELLSRYKTETGQAVPEDYDRALSELRATKRNVRIIGTGGTGKTQLINDYLAQMPPSERSSTLVVAPTGLAASHIGGVTIHKAFSLCNEVQTREVPQDIPQGLFKLQRVIIDEVSMLRIDIFERVVRILQQIEAQQRRHIQLIVLGDFGQLEPVCTKADRVLLRQLYPNTKGVYAFHSELWDKMNFKPIVLKYNFRQTDMEFFNQLTALKYGSLDALHWFNCRCSPFADIRAVYICPKNEDVEQYNRAAMAQFEDKKKSVFKAISEEIAPNTELPCPKELHLATGMRVMTVVNDRKYKNGSIGTIQKINTNSIRVLFDNGTAATVYRKKFILSDGSSYAQLPVILAYAFTVHKCQGCTFDAIVVIPGFFAAGQLYTALSRCRSMDGICIEGILSPSDLKIDVDALKMTL